MQEAREAEQEARHGRQEDREMEQEVRHGRQEARETFFLNAAAMSCLSYKGF